MRLADLLGFALDHFQRVRIEKAAMWLDTGTALDGAAQRLGFTPVNSGATSSVRRWSLGPGRCWSRRAGS